MIYTNLPIKSLEIGSFLLYILVELLCCMWYHLFNKLIERRTNMTIAQQMIEFRARNNMTQSELAKKLNVRQRSISIARNGNVFVIAVISFLWMVVD